MTTEPPPTDDVPPRPGERVIDLAIEVAGTPEEVWEAIASGPGISSWYVPTTVEEHLGGATTSRFGPGPEMLIPGRVTAWEPPHRVVFEGAEGMPSMAFEWLVEARDGGSCIVRLVNSGFYEGAPWNDQYDAMTEGWRLFLSNLQLHQAHFAGQHGVAMLPMAPWSGSPDDSWLRLTGALQINARPAVGEHLSSGAADAPTLSGTVVRADRRAIWLLLDAPAPGTAFLASEGDGVSVWSYLYGATAPAIVERDEPRWAAWLASHATG